ncbi:hypothetical protein GA0070607_0200 [Micromonospora coriariae]|uniref:Uncharacterized protein n=1 Tax=Micromonospora coriariae TaxID=285665 RepID=A0A1C4U686_9ACTN|nr:hypothetical protein GA0070607_0200 [Micromonospora coriariae]
MEVDCELMNSPRWEAASMPVACLRPACCIGGMSGSGGRRRGSAEPPDRWWQVATSRANAEHMCSREFVAWVDDLVVDGRTASTVITCSESMCWRCHRRLISDHLVLVPGIAVWHLNHHGRLAELRFAAGVRVASSKNWYMTCCERSLTDARESAERDGIWISEQRVGSLGGRIGRPLAPRGRSRGEPRRGRCLGGTARRLPRPVGRCGDNGAETETVRTGCCGGLGTPGCGAGRFGWAGGSALSVGGTSAVAGFADCRA